MEGVRAVRGQEERTPRVESIEACRMCVLLLLRPGGGAHGKRKNIYGPFVATPYFGLGLICVVLGLILGFRTTQIRPRPK